MKKYLKWAFPVLAIGLLAYLGWGFTDKLHHKQETTERIQTLPDFKAERLDKTIITHQTIANKQTILIYFDPDCEHCQREADELRKKLALLRQAEVIMLSSAPLPALKTFSQQHQLNNLPNVQVARIDRKAAYETFGFTSVPDVLIYHADGSLSKHFRGETSVEAIARNL